MFSVLLPAALGRDCLVFGSIGNAAADGKRMRVIDALPFQRAKAVDGRMPLKLAAGRRA
jgi:hypothetical protein